MNEKQINVGIGKIAFANPPKVLVSIGVGSCIVLCLYHKPTKTAGMAHIMLPGTGDEKDDLDKPAKYVKNAINYMIKKFNKMGIKNLNSIKAKLVGGAQLFVFKQVPNIGVRNIKETKEQLRKYGIRIMGSEVGGNCGRSVWFYSDTGKVVVKSRLTHQSEL